MQMLSFRKNKIETGMPIEPMANAMKVMGKKNPGATLDTVASDLLFYWEPGMGQGTATVVDEEGVETVHEMPYKSGKRKQPEALWVKGPCTLRLLPVAGPSFTIQTSASGSYTVSEGVDAAPVPVMADQPTDTLIQTQARTWLRDGRVGASSYALCVALTGVYDPTRSKPRADDVPWDSSDLGRCLAFFRAVPDARPLIGQMSEQGAYWAAIAPLWDTLEAHAAAGENGAIYDLIHQAVEGVREADMAADDDDNEAGPRISFRLRQ